jgi:hypothetical protein
VDSVPIRISQFPKDFVAFSLSLERVTAAAEERQLSHNSLIAYRRAWLKIIAWAAAEGLVLETFPVERGDVLWFQLLFSCELLTWQLLPNTQQL